MSILLLLLGFIGPGTEGVNAPNTSGKATLVDIRSAQSYKDMHIPGSVHMPFHQLKNKTWMKSKSIVLVGDALSNLDTMQQELEKRGFSNVTVLPGGLYGHYLKGGRVNSEAATIRNLGTVEPAGLGAYGLDDVLLVDLTANESTESYSSLDMPEADLEERLAEFLHQQDKEKLILLDQQGEMRDQVVNALHKLGHPGVFYLRGGKTAWQYYLHQQKEGRSQWRGAHKQPGTSALTAKKPCDCEKNKK